jgi:hypothetical protein
MTAIIKSLVLAFVLVGAAFAQEAFERLTSLNVADLVPRDLLGGPHYKVAPEARIAGYLPTFNVQSDFGRLFRSRRGDAARARKRTAGD